METVTVSPEQELVIPRSVCEKLHFQPGQRLHAVVWRGGVELIPVRMPQEMRGFLRGMSTDLVRESDRL